MTNFNARPYDGGDFYVIEFCGMANGPIEPIKPNPLYLGSADVDAEDGRGAFHLTYDYTMAMRFGNVSSAMQFWRQESRVRPLRPDGLPNRPLTCFHASFVKIDGL